MASKSVRSVIQRFKSALEKSGFPKARVYLFGSYARGEARPDSDIDLCLVSPLFKYKKESYQREATFIAYQTDPRIQIVLADPKKFRKDPLSPLFSHIRHEVEAA